MNSTFDATAIATRFVQARRNAQALPAFPGALPADLEQGYTIQDAAIAQWPDAIAGWKVGYIAPHRRDGAGDERLLGPVFGHALWRADDNERAIVFPVFVGGFAAVEAEFAFVLAADAPARKTSWSTEEAATIVARLHIAVETAGSPLSTINVLGPSVVVSDFGNNAGLILGAEIHDWAAIDFAQMPCACFIAGHEVGRGSAASLPGGPLSALAFALGRNARRGRPLRAGDVVTTGAATGIHDIRAGEHALVDFGRFGSLRCVAVAAQGNEHAHSP